MKITEVQVPSARRLQEAIEQDPPTGFVTEDLIRILQEDRSKTCWTKPMTYEELLAEMDQWDRE